jgi:hypothetical protein
VAAARLVGRVVSPALRRRGFAETEVVLRWPEIAGAELARVATPEKLSFRRGRSADGTLHLKVAGPAALAIQHQAPAIIERINTFYGFRAVARLNLVQGPANDSRAATPEQPQLAEPSPADKARIARAAARTDDPDLADALRRLGEAVAGRERAGQEKP